MYSPVRNCPQCNAECSDAHRFCPACGFPIGAMQPTSEDPLIGRKVGGAYVVLELVGAGGMGKVYRGEQIALGKVVAIKVLHPHLIADESAMARFYTEARASSRLNHPNSVSVLDFGRTEDGQLFLVMEFLRGRDLAHVLWQEGTFAPERAVDITRQVLGALAEAHELGIIHRDIKPENVIVDRLKTGNDSVKVVDFGLAKVRADVAPSVTMPGIVCGTPDYMAPEQGRGDPPDTRSDLYAVGIMLYQILTGQLPYEGESPTKVVLQHMTEPIRDPRAVKPSIPEPLARVVMHAMGKEPGDRYPTALEFARALEDAMRAAGPTTGPKSPLRQCPRCASPLEATSKFCSECGESTSTAPEESGRSTRPPPAMSRAALAEQRQTPIAPFVGREHELAVLHGCLERARAGRFVTARITGEMGAGKSRLVREFTARIARSGDPVVCVGPDPSWAQIPWAPLRELIRACIGVRADEEPSAWLRGRQDLGVHGLAIAVGFEELFGVNTAPLDGRTRQQAVVEACEFALSALARRSPSGVAVIVIERLHRVDTATLSVLSLLTTRAIAVPALLVATQSPETDPGWRDDEVLVLHGLPAPQAQQVSASLLAEWFTPPTFESPQTPLMADQSARWVFEGGGAPPKELRSLIHGRFEQLPSVARTVLQALALIGRSSRAKLAQVAEATVDEALWRNLVARWWIEETEGSVSISHELVREVIEEKTPPALRKQLAARWLVLRADLPLELRALLAAQAEEISQALLLFDAVAERASGRGDDAGAVLALRRGLDWARREMLRGELDEPERVLSLFSRKLGDALVRVGEVAEAEGVLREALALGSVGELELARLHLVLARALFGRGRVAEARRVAGETLAVARARRANGLLADVLTLLADFEFDIAAPQEAIAHLRAADVALAEIERSAHDPRSVCRQRIEVWRRLARALAATGHPHAAEAPLRDAAAAAHRVGLLVEVARCEAERAELALGSGEHSVAEGLFRRAAETASQCGDFVAAEMYRSAAKRARVGG